MHMDYRLLLILMYVSSILFCFFRTLFHIAPIVPKRAKYIKYQMKNIIINRNYLKLLEKLII